MTDPDQLLAGLDPEQREVATSLGGPVAVIAGAGTGKTRAITHRIAYGVAAGVYRPTSVLAVTFTTRAAGELRGRLAKLGAVGVQARTFHSAALRQAQYFWPRAYGSELPGIAENRMSLVAEAASRLRLQVDTARLRDLVGEIGWSKVSNVTVADYPRIAARNRRELASFDPETVARVFAGYEDIKRDRNRIDFEDILLCTAALISEHPQVAAEIRGTYRHLVVDEYQDVSPLQQALLDLWRGTSEDVCVVGDPAQTIHSFAGARSDYLRHFAHRHQDATVIRLVRDYRSTPQVVKVANAVMARARAVPGRDGRPDTSTGAVTLQAQRPGGPDVAFAEAADEPSEAAGVADWLAARHAAGVDYREMAVLFRVNAQSPAYEAALAERNIPYLVRGAERFFERPEVRQALITLRTQARTGSPATSAGEDGADDPAGSVVALVRAIFTSLGWAPEPPTGAGQLRERWESLAALVSAVEDVVAEQPAADLATVSAELDRRAEAQHVPAADGVTVSTLHSAKGLEWDAVAVVGAHEGTLPFVLATGEAEVEEERRLLYVGVTRARGHLRISWSRTRNGGGSQRQPSRFLDGIRPGDVGKAAAAQPSRSRRRGSVLSASCRQCGRPLTDAGERKLGRHHGCPSTYDEGVVTALRDWRREQAKEQSLPAFCIFTDATLIAIAESMPGSPAELTRISGIGPAKVAKYGTDVITLLGDRTAS